MRAPEFRLRTPSAGLLALPWDQPLSEWVVPDVPLRDIAVGMSRHLVKFVNADDQLWAVKDMPPRVAIKEYDVLRQLEDMGLPAVRPAGLVLQPEFDTAILVTRYLEGSWQYRRLFMRLPPDQPRHRARLLDAMAGLLVERIATVSSGATVHWRTPCSRGTASFLRPGWSTPRHPRCTQH